MSRLLLAVGLLLAVVSPLRADDLDRFLERDKLAVGELLSKVSKSLADSTGLEKTSPGAAVILLERRIAEVREASFLPEAERSAWLGKLQGRLRSVNETLRVTKLAAEEKATRDAEIAIRKMREAEPRKGSGVSDIGKRYIASASDQIAAADRLRRDRAAGTLGVFRDIEASATPVSGVVEFPKHWARITDSPYRGSGKKLTPKEVALLKTLNSTMSVDFDARSFKEVINYIQEKTGLSIFVDKASLEEAGIDYDTPVTFKVPTKISVRTVLKKVLADNNLTYIIKEGAIQVMTPQKARDLMVVRTYPIQDLVGLTDARFDPFLNRAMMLNNVQGLIKSIQTAIDPALWDINGGPGSIAFHEPSMSLIIRAPAEMHYMMGSGSLLR